MDSRFIHYLFFLTLIGAVAVNAYEVQESEENKPLTREEYSAIFNRELRPKAESIDTYRCRELLSLPVCSTHHAVSSQVQNFAFDRRNSISAAFKEAGNIKDFERLVKLRGEVTQSQIDGPMPWNMMESPVPIMERSSGIAYVKLLTEDIRISYASCIEKQKATAMADRSAKPSAIEVEREVFTIKAGCLHSATDKVLAEATPAKALPAKP